MRVVFVILMLGFSKLALGNSSIHIMPGSKFTVETSVQGSEGYIFINGMQVSQPDFLSGFCYIGFLKNFEALPQNLMLEIEGVDGHFTRNSPSPYDRSMYQTVFHFKQNDYINLIGCQTPTGVLEETPIATMHAHLGNIFSYSLKLDPSIDSGIGLPLTQVPNSLYFRVPDADELLTPKLGALNGSCSWDQASPNPQPPKPGRKYAYKWMWGGYDYSAYDGKLRHYIDLFFEDDYMIRCGTNSTEPITFEFMQMKLDKQFIFAY